MGHKFKKGDYVAVNSIGASRFDHVEWVRDAFKNKHRFRVISYENGMVILARADVDNSESREVHELYYDILTKFDQGGVDRPTEEDEKPLNQHDARLEERARLVKEAEPSEVVKLKHELKLKRERIAELECLVLQAASQGKLTREPTEEECKRDATRSGHYAEALATAARWVCFASAVAAASAAYFFGG